MLQTSTESFLVQEVCLQEKEQKGLQSINRITNTLHNINDLVRKTCFLSQHEKK